MPAVDPGQQSSVQVEIGQDSGGVAVPGELLDQHDFDAVAGRQVAMPRFAVRPAAVSWPMASNTARYQSAQVAVVGHQYVADVRVAHPAGGIVDGGWRAWC
ncbi:hypothetical protein [Streptomyces sp. NPDC054797]